ncbi:heat shock 70 kDa protein 14 isoform X2 [Bos indicus]|uniref:Heat shock 70 kDa protein 14 n=4 Tax=Bos TaxID=9903 RepID=G3MY73_BOVIN|nr:PREDICTED: heat shock 70 kDa protein 14 isoform X2 [Bos indicus]XP_027415683.1 heat shock 70 kDa protein 14 isoform X1 [Bos indicus x Bos taurus]XP_027415684.1 heat shock 70 kDa protein 14 isoform X1 [Bos indicus x Bos taurus]XP_027415685.1 heat shock 70 kDa protein 14 isoform X1 [Bos indicus x Bos taurus]XP_059748674.1 heat shock 70 kDa protein 14 isoform X1 [Bos taurus]XP_059748676.1 heat shock 70 kDa protein 14 isoform X1 [Bos taurus]XP_059748677.1 heat shock 70 kDa protein 14 isoform X
MATSNSSAGIRWSRQETRTLLSILGEAEYIQRLQTVHHNADVYQAVSKRMQQEGFRRTERQCRSKFKVLKALYLKAYVAHATSMGDPPHCPFYDTLDQLLRNQIVTDADNLMEDAAWAKHSDLNLAAPDTPGEEGTSILGAKRTQAAEHQPILKTVKESDDCQLRVSDQMPETSDLEDSWDESSGAGCSQGTPSYSSSHHLFRGAAAPCQSIPMTRLAVSGEPSPCSSSSRNIHGVASAQQPPASSSRAPFVSGGDRPLTSEPPPRWARRRRRSVARTIAAELAENRRLARELSKREQEKLDRLIAIGEEASAQQDTANELRRDAVVAVRRLATAVEEATGAFQLGLEKLLQSSDDPQSRKYITESKCLVIEKNGKLLYEIDTGEEKKFVSPEDVARLIFSKMKETAHSVLGSDANDVVITVPFDFGEKQKSALGEAARAAGFNVLRLIHEPSAALLAYGIGQDSPTGKSNILVFKLGGTSLSISVMEVNSGIYRVLSTNTDNNIGGTHFTETLAQYLASEFQRSFRHDVRGNARAMMKLMNGADTAKHSLSTLGSANCFLDSLYEGQDFDCNVSRARFELLCSPLFNKCIEAIREVLEQSGFTADDINKVVLCGGSSRIPRLQQMIRDLFPAVELLNSIPPDEVIPIGAAIEAGILIGKESLSVEDALQIECSAKDILVKGVDESGANSFKVLFPSGTPLPARRQHTLQAPGSISSVCLELYESEGKNSAKVENKFAQVVLQDLDKKENGLRDILAVLTMKRDGSLHVTCTDQETGKCEAITIEVAS